MYTAAQIQVVIYCSNLVYMNRASSNIVHKANVVIQKMFIKPARGNSRYLENNEKQNTVGISQGWLEKRHRSESLQQQ